MNTPLPRLLKVQQVLQLTTLLDHVHVLPPDYVKEMCIPKISISDHCPVCIRWFKSNNSKNKPYDTDHNVTGSSTRGFNNDSV